MAPALCPWQLSQTPFWHQSVNKHIKLSIQYEDSGNKIHAKQIEKGGKWIIAKRKI
jgi:hypothetical protein